MKANEFRLSNLAQDKLTGELMICTGTSCEIDGTEPKIWFSVMDRSKYPLPKGWQAEPIPLTEEWFLKFGFDYQFEVLNFPNNDIFGVKATSKGFELITYNSEDTTETGVIIKHVHQLQNLYFALTGEELQIKVEA